MDKLEEIIKTESSKYEVGRLQCAELLNQITRKGKELRLTEEALASNIRKIVSFTKFSTNYYQFLSRVNYFYCNANNEITAQGMIDSFHYTYNSRKYTIRGDKFTEEEIELSLSAYREDNYLRIN
ncbi:hypothetical protein EXS72_00630 [Candidatus Pacearchaeota archaeon]|nr:hypothetical protein [Candidatus Pacearchaeota archaeon]